MGALMQTGDFARTFSQGSPNLALAGPMIEVMDYPAVLVARAWSDGDRLEAVFYPGKAPGAFEVPLSQLQPGREYRVTGAQEDRLLADENGQASCTVRIDGRSEFKIEPV
jgi:hypothetical protein